MRICKNIIRFLFLSAALLVIPYPSAHAQYFTLGPDPSGINWKQIKGEHFDVIYPENTDSLARHYLYLFEATRERNMSSLHIEGMHVPIIIHPYSVQSSASVAWAPKRVDILSTPESQPDFSMNWDKQLALHEGRRVVQMSHYMQGFYKILSYIAGEQSIAVGVGINPRGALLEGDAIIHETEFSQSGRGRSGDLLMYYRAAFLNGDMRIEPCWRFGSYNKYAPEKDIYGYLVTALARYQSGNYYTSGDIMQQQCWWWWRILDSSHWSYRYGSGLTQRQNWYRGQEKFTEWWREDFYFRAPYSYVDTLTAKRDHHYLEYINTLPLPGGRALATKFGKQQAHHIVTIDSLGKEHYKKPFSSQTSRMVTDNKGHYYFSEIVPDPRWNLRSFSILREYSVDNNKYRNLSRRSRYFNPYLSPDGESLIAVENMPETGSNSKIVTIRISDGKKLDEVAAPTGWHITESLMYDGKIYAIAIIDEGAGIACYENGRWRMIVEPQPSLLRDFSVSEKGELIVVSDLNGVNNAYMVKVASDDSYELLQLNSAQFGTLRPTISGDEMYYSDYEHRGYNPVKTPLDSLFYKPTRFEYKYVDRISDSIARQSARMAPKWTEQQDSVLRRQIDSLPSSKYNKFLNGFHFHSWLPLYAEIDKIKALSLENIWSLVRPGVMVMSQNNLGTLQSTLGYSYHNGFHSGHVNLQYSGLFPVIEARFDFNERKKTMTTMYQLEIPPEIGKPIPVDYDIDTTNTPSLDFFARTYIPFDFSRSGWNISVIPDIEYSISNDKISTYGEKMRNVQNLLLNVHYLQTLSEPTARLIPRFGWGVSLNYATGVGPVNNLGKLFYSNLYGFLPGFNEVQGLKLGWSWQKQISNYPYAYLPNMAAPVRGYDKTILTDFHKFSMDYAIPIYGCIDGLTTFFFYLQRFILIPFADLAINASDLAISESGEILAKGAPIQYSFGTKFLVDLHLFRFGFGLKLGVQYAYTGEKHNSFKFMMNVGL